MRIILALYVLIALSLLAGPVLAQGLHGCFPRSALPQTLYEIRKARIGSGRTPGQVLEVWTNEDHSHWVITAQSDGSTMLCIVAGGDNWKTQEWKPPAPPRSKDMKT